MAALCLTVPFPSVVIHLYFGVLAALCLVELAWRRHCRDAPDGGSHARWRELPAAATRLIGFGFGVGTMITQAWLEKLEMDRQAGSCGAIGCSSDSSSGSSSSGGGSQGVYLECCRHATILLISSGITTSIKFWAKPVRIRWAEAGGRVAACAVLHGRGSGATCPASWPGLRISHLSSAP